MVKDGIKGSRVFFNLSLWIGLNRGKLHALPPRIPEKDRGLIRYWINHALQLTEEGTALTVRVVDREGRPVSNSRVYFVGNFTGPEREQVNDILELKANGDGRVSLRFPKWSVVSSLWFVSAEAGGRKSGYAYLEVIPGEVREARNNVRLKGE
ncbi:MAG: hypothetical protein JRJ29_12530 [Deltaproteobacteria bacterium]|nr:hypothetical protein [Deltaproteobacteria bacterium]